MKRWIVISLIVIACLASFGAGAAARRVAQLCSWGGTPAAPTGEVTVTPGVTSTPAAAPLKLLATGTLEGGGRCKGTMTFDGFVRAGSTCAQAWFDGRVRGLPGVARFSGPGFATIVHEFLYDKRGNIVGADQPMLQVPQPEGYSHAQDCFTPEGFTRGRFSSTVELF